MKANFASRYFFIAVSLLANVNSSTAKALEAPTKMLKSGAQSENFKENPQSAHGSPTPHQQQAPEAAGSKKPDQMDWKKLAIEFQDNRKKANPMLYSESARSKLDLASYACSNNLREKIDQCQFHNCIYPIDLPGGLKVSADLIVHGYNKTGSCVVSAPNAKRYFIPKTDLPYFHDALIASLRLDKAGESVSASTQSNISKIKRKIFYKDAVCIVNLEIQNILDESNVLLATPANVKMYPQRTVVTANGKEYIGKNSDFPEFKFIEKYISASLDKSSAPVCKEKKIDLIYQLAVKNFEFALTPVKIGFPTEGIF